MEVLRTIPAGPFKRIAANIVPKRSECASDAGQNAGLEMLSGGCGEKAC